MTRLPTAIFGLQLLEPKPNLSIPNTYDDDNLSKERTGSSSSIVGSASTGVKFVGKNGYSFSPSALVATPCITYLYLLPPSHELLVIKVEGIGQDL